MNLECSYWRSFGLMLRSIQLYFNANMSILVAVVSDDNKKPNQLNLILPYFHIHQIILTMRHDP